MNVITGDPFAFPLKPWRERVKRNKEGVVSVIFEVLKMGCQVCARHVAEAIEAALPGADVKINLETKQVEVAPSPPDPDVLVAALEAAGYPARQINPE